MGTATGVGTALLLAHDPPREFVQRSIDGFADFGGTGTHVQQPAVTEPRPHLALSIDATLGAVQVGHRNRKPIDPVRHSTQQADGAPDDGIVQVGMAGVMVVQQIDAHDGSPAGNVLIRTRQHRKGSRNGTAVQPILIFPNGERMRSGKRQNDAATVYDAGMRRPSRLFVLPVLVAMLGLAACRRDEPDPPVAAVPVLAPLPEAFDGEWRGLLSCADCAGIEIELVLRRDAAAAGFVLVERYLGGATPGDYRSEGAWREVACQAAGEPGLCIELEGPGLVWFRHADGTLAAIDGVGRALDADGARLQRL